MIWKLDRMGRSLCHLVELVGDLVAREVGLLSLNDPLDTTSAQGRLVFNLFASLAEFERELIRERTQAGLVAARARGRVGGRPKGIPSGAEETALAAVTLYRERQLSANAIAKKLHIAKNTLHRYLRHRGVEIGRYEKPSKGPTPRQALTGNDSPAGASANVANILLRVRVEINSKFVRGKKRALENIEIFVLEQFSAERRPSGEYELKVHYSSDEDLDSIMGELLSDIEVEADLRNCFAESSAQLEGTDRHWS